MKQLYKLSVLAVIGSMMIVSGCNDSNGMMKKNGKKPMPKDQMTNKKYQKQMNKGAMMDSNDGCMMRQQKNSRYNNGN